MNNIEYCVHRYNYVVHIFLSRTVKELCDEYGLSMAQLAKRFGIPYRTVQDWFGGKRTPPDYLVKMMAEILLHSTEGKE